ncbi:sodium-independent anion transporter [Streptomyces sp. NPDC058409]|uniref:sodium-independent anion transporter n=1 Tax=Streptomyces sp. NPDC058409 TaxID=3346484 RepID=UPI0036530D94
MLLFDLLSGLLLAVALSLVLFIAAASRRNVSALGLLPGTRLYADTAQHPDAATTPGVLAVRPDGSLFFGNVNRVRLAVRDQVAGTAPPPRAVVLDLTGSYRLGIPVLDALDELREELARQDIALHLAHVRARAEQDLTRHALAGHLGPRGRHRTVDDAVSAATGGPA